MASKRKNNKTSLDNPEYLWRHSPVSFTSNTAIVSFIRDKTKFDPDLRRRALQNWSKFTQKIEVGSRSFQRVNKKRQFNYILGTSKNHLFQMDIADLFGDNRDRISQKKGNDNMKYILVIINSLTKYAYAYPLPNRENTSIISTLEIAFEDMGLKKCTTKKYFSTNIQVDQEFTVGKNLQKFFKDWCVNVYYTQSKHKACMAERFIRYLKEKLASRMERRTEVWLPLLKDLIKQYNTLRKQTTIDMTPQTAEKYPSMAFVKIVEKNIRKAEKYPARKKYKFKAGDKVRALVDSHNIFRKDYQARFTYDIYTIYQRRKVRNVNLYYLKNRKDSELKGSYREDQLKLADDKDEEYPYTIVRRRGNKTLVHYDGFNESEDEWLDNKELDRRTAEK